MLGAARPWTTSLPIHGAITLDKTSKCLLSTACTSSRHGSISSSRPWNTSFSRNEPLLNNSFNARKHSDILFSTRLTLPSYVVQPFSRHASSSSNNRWLNRQKSDPFTRATKLNNLKSRAAFKLLQINDRYRIFRPGQTVVDLGFAPGSWSQVAIDLVRPGLGRVVGVDIIPVAPPRGVNGLQGDFLSKATQDRVRDLLRDETAGRARRGPLIGDGQAADVQDDGSYIDRAAASQSESEPEQIIDDAEHRDRVVDIVLSDMSAPWEMPIAPYKKSVGNPYYRMMNTSGNRFKDHAGSMDLCRSALYFAYDTLKIGGNFVCKFYQGAEDKQFERQLKAMFHKVHREKPESSRSESKESFFVGIKRLAKVDKNAVFDEGS